MRMCHKIDISITFCGQTCGAQCQPPLCRSLVGFWRHIAGFLENLSFRFRLPSAGRCCPLPAAGALRHGAVTSYPRCGALPAAGAGLGLSRIVRLPPGASGRRVCHGVLVNDNALMDPWCTYVETQTHRSVKVGKDFQDHPVQLSTPKPQTTSPDSSRTLLGMVTPPPPWETNSQCLTTQRLKKFSSNI